MKILTNRIIILILIQVGLVFSSISAIADTFGQSCSELPMVDSQGYLTNDTAYGFIKNHLDMKTHVKNACNSSGNELKFCIRNKIGSAAVCTPATMQIGSKIRLGTLTSNTDITKIPSLANIILNVQKIENQICLTMPTSRGMTPIMCRNGESTGVTDEQVNEICRTLGRSCYDGRAKSQSLLSFSGLTIHCLRDTLNKVMYVGNQCPEFDNDIVISTLRPFSEFSEAIKLTVRGALILYVMVFGFKIVMNHEYSHLNKIAVFLLKFIFVAYFAVSLGAKTMEYGKEVQHNGMTELALPILVEMTSNFAEYVLTAAGTKGLCDFDKSKYEQGYQFYKIWDAIDCRIGYYLGMKVLYNQGEILKSLNSSTASSGDNTAINWKGGKNGIDALNAVGALAFFSVMFGLFMAGNIIIVMMGIIFVIVFVSVLMYFMSAYLVCMVTLYVMAYISPLFIPMVLFERTKAYFDSWLRIVISCTLQPAVIAGFIAMLLTMYDSAIYGTCEFLRHDYVVGNTNFSTFELRLPSFEPEKCIHSVGYKLMQYYTGQGWEKKILMLFEVFKIQDYLNLAVSFLYVMLYVVIFYFFIKSVNTFASDLVEGPSVGSVTVNPNMLIDKMKNLASAAASATSAAAKGQSGDPSAANDAADAADKAAEDTSSSEKEGASDKASTSGGGGKEAMDSISQVGKSGGGG
ncbi:MAG: type IV secretion system protein [Rickettsiaceae bacterium]